MPRTPPPLPAGRPTTFRATVHGTVFAGRERLLDELDPGDDLVLIPDPPGQDDPQVWVHLMAGDPLGHLPPEIGAWLAPWMRAGGRPWVRVLRVHDAETPSWRRLLVEVGCGVEREA